LCGEDESGSIVHEGVQWEALCDVRLLPALAALYCIGVLAAAIDCLLSTWQRDQDLSSADIWRILAGEEKADEEHIFAEASAKIEDERASGLVVSEDLKLVLEQMELDEWQRETFAVREAARLALCMLAICLFEAPCESDFSRSEYRLSDKRRLKMKDETLEREMMIANNKEAFVTLVYEHLQETDLLFTPYDAAAAPAPVTPPPAAINGDEAPAVLEVLFGSDSDDDELR